MKRILPLLLLSVCVAVIPYAAGAVGVVGLAPKTPTAAQTAIYNKLNKTVQGFDFPGGDLAGTLSAIGRAMEVPIIVEDDVKGKINFTIDGLSLRQLLTAACTANRVFFYVHPDGYVVVRSKIRRLYPVDVLSVERTVSSSSNMSMSSSGIGELGGGGSFGGVGGTGAAGGAATAAGGISSAGLGSGTTAGSQIQVTGKNDDKFWSEFDDHIKSKAKAGEQVEIDHSAGFVYADAGLDTHAGIEAYWRMSMARQGRGATVQVYVLDLNYGDQNQFGVNWSAAPFRVGGIFENAVRVKDVSSTVNTIDSVAGVALSAPTVQATIAAGKLSAFISALQSQTKVANYSAPSIGLLNNRTSVVQISNDKNFFSRSEDTIINDGTASGGTLGGSALTPITRRKYSIQQYDFGLFMPVTVQIADNNVVTLDMAPSLTDFTGVDVSQDGNLTAPEKQKRQFSTQIKLRDGQAYVMGGFTHGTKGNQTQAVPIVSKIPVLGKAFQNDAKVEQRGELLIVVQVSVRNMEVPDPVEVYTPYPGSGVTADMFGPAEVAMNAPAASPAAPVLPAAALKEAVKATEAGRSVLIDLGLGDTK